MKLEAAYPIIVTERLADCRQFYTRRLGFEIVFEATWFVYLQAPGSPYGIAFMAPDHPSQPPGPETFTGHGMFLTLQVADAAAEFERLSQAGVTIAYPLRDEAWGQRRFGVVDPAGMWLDVVQQIEPQPGFWDPYIRSTG
jgi:catechol 2,3-dioxygenase-like lactoylglutathione lyase family enzyme